MTRPHPLASILLAACLAFFGARVDAAEDLGRFAEPAEVVGYWKLVRWTTALKQTNAVEPWSLPFQYFAFYPDGLLLSHMASDDPKDTAASLDALRGMLPPSVTYRFQDGFLLVENADDPDYLEIWGVNRITRTFEREGVRFEPGDLLMSLDDGHGNVVYRRHLRRIDAPGGATP